MAMGALHMHVLRIVIRITFERRKPSAVDSVGRPGWCAEWPPAARGAPSSLFCVSPGETLP